MVGCPGCRQRGTHVSLRVAIFPPRQWTYSSFCRSTCPLQQVNTLENGLAHYPLPSVTSIPAVYREKKMLVRGGESACARKREKWIEMDRQRERKRKVEGVKRENSIKRKNDDPFPIDIMPSFLSFLSFLYSFLFLLFYFLFFPFPFDHRYFPLTMPTMTRIMKCRITRRFLFVVEKDPLKGRQPRLRLQ